MADKKPSMNRPRQKLTPEYMGLNRPPPTPEQLTCNDCGQTFPHLAALVAHVHQARRGDRRQGKPT